MSFDYSTLITDRTQADVSRVEQLAAKIKAGTTSESELAEFNSASMKGAYNYTDLNRVTAAMEDLKAKLEGYGYAVPGYQRIKVPHVLPEPEPTSRLPEGYLELTYIESMGTQYVDAVFKPNQNTRVVMDVQATSANTYAYFGGRNGSLSKSMTFFMLSANAKTVRYDYGATEVTVTATALLDRVVIDADKNTFNYGGVTGTHSANTFQSDYSLFLLAVNNGGKASYHIPAKLYSCQIYDNDTLIRDYVPCINPSGDVGLFDVVNNQFYGNAGSGVFFAGDRVGVALPDGYTRLSHIESAGTQYVDTGVPHSLTSKIKLDATLKYTNVSGTQIMGFSGNAGYAIGVANGKWWDMSGNSINATVETKYSISLFTNGATFQKTVNNTTVSGSRAEYSQAKNMLLFAAWDTMSASVVSYHLRSKIYDARIYVNDVLMRDFVPCVNSSGVVGLYDLVTGAFFGNNGSGSFIAGAIPRELPEGYTQVEYIESNSGGTQYIDTGFKPNNNTRVVMDAQMASASTAHFYFGARNTGATISYDLLWTNGSIRSDYGESKLTFDGVDSTSRLVIDKNKNVCNVNGVSVTNTASTFQLGYSLYLFASHDYGSAKYHGTVKVYSCKIYDNGTLIRDYVPCKNSGGVFGLYDLANDVFYQNAGSGTFAAGEEVTALAVSSVAAVSAMVVSDDVTEYDPYTWYEFDWPTPETMTIYLLNVVALRSVFAVMASTPSVPPDMVSLMAEEANNIEKILADINELLMKSTQVWFYSGDLFAGEV